MNRNAPPAFWHFIVLLEAVGIIYFCIQDPDGNASTLSFLEKQGFSMFFEDKNDLHL
uniref:Uncharacterized protein n=1 Tax=Nelumbo nucifera TaxID=4432 RepID=A0A822ZI42_NELNU|nr:TPA_asm: hypothetical protein HUJ06_001561 [Nelumbo nucifera]